MCKSSSVAGLFTQVRFNKITKEFSCHLVSFKWLLHAYQKKKKTWIKRLGFKIVSNKMIKIEYGEQNVEGGNWLGINQIYSS